MYKRRDWIHLHGQQAAEAGSDDSQSDDSQGDPQGSEEDERWPNDSSSGSSGAGEASSSEEEEDERPDLEHAGEEGSPPAHRLEDLSEDDFDGTPGPDSEEEDEAAEQRLLEQKQNWMEAARADAVKGKPLTCTACKAVLLLNAESLRRHLTSKKHMRQLKACQPGVDPVRFAGSARQSDPEVETHWERGARVGREAATLQAAAAKPKKRKRHGGGPSGTKRKGSKPGKRQRQLLQSGGKES